MMDLMAELKEKVSLLDKAITSYGKRGRAAAQADADYRIGFAKKMLQLKAEGVAATLIPDLAKGSEEVAPLLLDRQIKESERDSAKEAINAYKLQIKVLEDQIEREWHSQ